MEHLIDKYALIAKIEKEIKHIYAGREYVGIPSNEENVVMGLQKAEDIINTIEVKEVDLEKEYKQFVQDDPVYNKLVNDIVGKAIAKHFFELGIKTRKIEAK